MAWCLVKHRDKLTFYLYLHSPYSSWNTVSVIKTRRMKWAGHGHEDSSRGLMNCDAT